MSQSYLDYIPIEIVKIIFDMSNNPFTNILLNEMNQETTIDERSLICYTCYHDNVDMFKIIKKRNPGLTRKSFFNNCIVSSFSLNILDYCMANKFLMEPERKLRIGDIESQRNDYFESTRSIWKCIDDSNIRLSSENRKKCEHYYQIWEGITNRTIRASNKPLRRYNIALLRMEIFYLDFISSFYHGETFRILTQSKRTCL